MSIPDESGAATRRITRAQPPVKRRSTSSGCGTSAASSSLASTAAIEVDTHRAERRLRRRRGRLEGHECTRVSAEHRRQRLPHARGNAAGSKLTELEILVVATHWILLHR